MATDTTRRLMTAPRADLLAILDIPVHAPADGFCVGCGYSWPCPAAVTLADVTPPTWNPQGAHRC